MDSKEEKQFLCVSHGGYILCETAQPNQFHFYREDGKVLGDVGRLPMDMYQAYICQKMMSGEITTVVMNNILFETSTDGKCIRLTTEQVKNTMGIKPIVIEKSKDETIGQKIKSLFKRKK